MGQKEEGRKGGREEERNRDAIKQATAPTTATALCMSSMPLATMQQPLWPAHARRSIGWVLCIGCLGVLCSISSLCDHPRLCVHPPRFAVARCANEQGARPC